MWPGIGIVGIGMAIALLGLFSFVPGYIHAILLLIFFISAGYFFWSTFSQVRGPNWVEGARRIEMPARRGQTEEVAGVGSADREDEHGAIAVDEHVDGGEREVGEGLEPDSVDALDVLAPFEHALADRFAALAGEDVRWAVRVYAALTIARHVYLCTRSADRAPLFPALLALAQERLDRTAAEGGHA
jgi:ABC-type microcin C transport system permease subunit YejB